MDDRHFRSVVKEARAALRRRRFDEAIAMLEAVCRERPDVPAEALLAECRFRAGAAASRRIGAANARPPEMRAPDNSFATVAGIPEIPGAQLNAEALAAGIGGHGALLVRGLLAHPQARELAADIDKVIDACRDWHIQKQASPWYSPLPLGRDPQLRHARGWVESAGGVWAVDSPRGLRELIDVYRDTAIVDTLSAYFGERPMLSVDKFTLRRVPADIKLSEWHQDGAFMGSDIRSVNVWLCLSDCGVDASGLDVIPQRIEKILPTGTGGAIFNWAVGQEVVEAELPGVAVSTPHFAPGDALLFDHFFLHRTGIPAGITRERHAVEAWFFAPSAYPKTQLPLKI